MMKARPRVQGRTVPGPFMNSPTDRGGGGGGGGGSLHLSDRASVLPWSAPSPPAPMPSRRRRQLMLVLKLALVVQLAIFLVVRWRAASRGGTVVTAGGATGGLATSEAHFFNEEDEARNSLRWQRMREKIDDECRSGRKRRGTSESSVQSKTALQWRSKLDQASTNAQNVASSSSSPLASNETERCRFTFFDFGANVGDSLGKFISVGIPTCDNGDQNNRTDVNASATSPSTFAGHTPQSNRLVRWSKKILEDLGQQLEGRTLQPEHYCYIGIEGNPVFTSRLQQLQQQIVRMQPRPVKWAHFYTETVGAISNDPTVLYLDTKNADKNYWGSSTLYTHRDVQASANAEGQVYQAQVQGVTLTSLLQRHVVNDHGSHVLIKLDIEGSEYAVLNEAAESGILCELSAQAVQIDVMVEVHSKQVIGALDEMEYFRHAVKSNLEKLCGVNLHLTMEAD